MKQFFVMLGCMILGGCLVFFLQNQFFCTDQVNQVLGSGLIISGERAPEVFEQLLQMKKEDGGFSIFKSTDDGSLSGYYDSITFNNKRFGSDDGFMYFYGRISKSISTGILEFLSSENIEITGRLTDYSIHSIIQRNSDIYDICLNVNFLHSYTYKNTVDTGYYPSQGTGCFKGSFSGDQLMIDVHNS